TTVTPLLAPGSLIASCISATSVRLSWNQVSGAGAYQLRINKLNNGGSSAWEPGQNGDSTPVAQGGSTTSHTMSVDAGAQYHWTIQAVKPNESYPFSGQSSDGGYFTCSAGGGGPGA
ncbi:MAG: fibronectin type III domain-containing protein, partial [Patescibacteria group bacterium]